MRRSKDISKGDGVLDQFMEEAAGFVGELKAQDDPLFDQVFELDH